MLNLLSYKSIICSICEGLRTGFFKITEDFHGLPTAEESCCCHIV